jgi:hypothetical protein
LKVEYVVKPPITPVASASLRLGEIQDVEADSCRMTARRNEPITLTATVPQGNAGPNRSSIQDESR